MDRSISAATPSAQSVWPEPQDFTDAQRTEAALRKSEARLRFLDTLGRATASSTDADSIMAITTRMVGGYLRVAICAYADMDDDQDGFSIRGDWSAPGLPSIVGHYRLADFGKSGAGGRPRQ
jgi:hypothetical protein